MKLLGIIPARGGSKGIKGKNLKKVGGDSLLKRAIKSIDNLMDTIVSTDDEFIQKEALKIGAKVPFLRSKELSEDNSNSIDVVIDAIEKYEKLTNTIYDYVFLIEPTSPFREIKHVKKVIEKIKTNKFKTVITVCGLERKPENIFIKDTYLEKYIKNPNEIFEQRQKMQNLCRLNSAVYAMSRNVLMKEKKFLNKPIGYVEMSFLESINIDTILDLQFANYLSEKYKI